MHDNCYIRNLVRMYQNAIAEKEKLAQKPPKWEDCKEYFKLWVAHKFFLSKEVSEYITDNIKFGPSSLSVRLLELMHKKLDET